MPGGLGLGGGGAGVRIVVRMPPPLRPPMDGSERRRRRGGGGGGATVGFFLGLRCNEGRFRVGCAGGIGGVREQAMEEARTAWFCALALAMVVREVEDALVRFRGRDIPALGSGPEEVVERTVGRRGGVGGGTDGNSVSVFRTAAIGKEGLPSLGTGCWGTDGNVGLLGT